MIGYGLNTFLADFDMIMEQGFAHLERIALTPYLNSQHKALTSTREQTPWQTITAVKIKRKTQRRGGLKSP